MGTRHFESATPVLAQEHLSMNVGCLPLQRFGQGNALRKSIFELIAAELIKALPPLPPLEPSQAASASPSFHGSGHGLSFVRCSPKPSFICSFSKLLTKCVFPPFSHDRGLSACPSPHLP